jgi:hypothetical protein
MTLLQVNRFVGAASPLKNPAFGDADEIRTLRLKRSRSGRFHPERGRVCIGVA